MSLDTSDFSNCSAQPWLSFLSKILEHAVNNHLSFQFGRTLTLNHLKLNPSKTRLFYISGDAFLCQNLIKAPRRTLSHTICQCIQPWCSSGQSDIIRRIQLLLFIEATLPLFQFIVTVSLDPKCSCMPCYLSSLVSVCLQKNTKDSPLH